MKSLLLSFSFIFCSATLLAQTNFINEDFNLSALPAGWTTTAVSGTNNWNFQIDGSATLSGNNNLNGTPMAFFDDDSLGVNSKNNTAQLTSPVFDNSSSINCSLTFEYNFRQFQLNTDSFFVHVFDGTNWNTVFFRSTNDCGNYLGPCSGNFPTANIDISAYKNSNCQIRFTYHDGNDWGWYVGIDNVRVYEPISTSIEKNDEEFSLTLSPNPSTGVFNLNVSSEYIGSKYKIYDITGSIVAVSKIGSNLTQIELNNVDKGIYFFRLEGINKVEKLVIQ